MTELKTTGSLLASAGNYAPVRGMVTPTDIQLIGSEVALRWEDGHESFISFATLRAASPSAQVRGERDVFGTVYGGEAPRSYVGVEVTGWERIGNYAIRFEFNDGHRTGLYSYELLRQLGDLPKA
jgi:DUF971 family protein